MAGNDFRSGAFNGSFGPGWNPGGFATGPSSYAWGGPGASGPATDGVLSRRLVAYLFDICAIFFLTLLLALVVGIFGLVTFGLGWALYAVLVPGTAILYSAVTIGGPAQGTLGMRAMGLAAVEAETGGRVPMLTAGIHALLFYAGVGTFLLLVLDVVIGLARSDRRLGHDLLVGMTIVRRS